jgi:cobalt-zinc-cadmium resistance protein CzcA
LFTLERVERRLFTPMAFTVCAALVGSLLSALTLIPVLATYLFSERPAWQNPLLPWLSNRYEWILRHLLRGPAIVAWCALRVVLASAGVIQRSQPAVNAHTLVAPGELRGPHNFRLRNDFQSTCLRKF